MRVIAGKASGRKLVSAKEKTLRPITSRLKESLFAILGVDIPSSGVLDLYAGSGSLGIECLSRGAREVIFVDNSRECARAIEKNLESFDFTADVYNIKAEEALALFVRREKFFDVIFAEPPFSDAHFGETVFPRLGSIISDGGIVVVRCHWKTSFPDGTERLSLVRQKKCGENKLLFYAAA